MPPTLSGCLSLDALNEDRKVDAAAAATTDAIAAPDGGFVAWLQCASSFSLFVSSLGSLRTGHSQYILIPHFVDRLYPGVLSHLPWAREWPVLSLRLFTTAGVDWIFGVCPWNGDEEFMHSIVAGGHWSALNPFCSTRR